MATRTRSVGEFCWVNMLTPEPAAARDFFAALLGWTYSDMAGMGHLIRVGGKEIGGLFDSRGPNSPPNSPAAIGVMVKVDDVDAACARIVALGGTAKEPFDILDQGRMAVCADPNGAQFDLWQGKRMRGFEVDNALQGAPSWFETLTTDVDRAIRFYSELFGWTPVAQPNPGFDYIDFTLEGRDVAGLMQIPAGMNDSPHWGVYFTVSDVDEAAASATRLGGTLCVPVRDIPNVGRFCGIVSPQGVMFYAIQYSN